MAIIHWIPIPTRDIDKIRPGIPIYTTYIGSVEGQPYEHKMYFREISRSEIPVNCVAVYIEHVSEFKTHPRTSEEAHREFREMRAAAGFTG